MQQSVPGRFAAYLFDLDGTLVDTAADLSEALNHALTEYGHQPVDRSQARNWIGQGARAAIERALIHQRAPSDHLDAMLESFLEHYEAHIARFSRAFSRVPETLAEMAGRGARLAVVTNKRARLTHLLLHALDLHRFFEVLVAGDTTPHPKPAADPALFACSALCIEPASALFVGDSAADVGCARAAGCPVACVTYGYHQGTGADQLGADAVIESFSDLL